jgi:glycosyltransferase involved in cell wall biosynthesis
MKIVHVYKDYPPVLGGIENHVKFLAEGQAARGHEVTALVTNPEGRRTAIVTEGGVRVVRAGRLATVASTPLTLALPWQLLRMQPEIVHLHYPYPVGESSQWLLRRGRGTVLTYHADIVRQKSILRFYQPLLVRVLGRADAIIIGSPPMRAGAFLAPYGSKLRLIPYGIPLSRFSGRPAETDKQVRAPRLLFVGRLRHYKGLDYLIRALPHIEARLLVVGIGPMEAEWRALAEEQGVSEKVAWLGEVSDEDLPRLYRSADLFVLPASNASEAFGLVQVEAMAAGLPVVSTELGTGTSYVNRDGVTGLVVAPRDSAALAQAITTLLSDDGRRLAMGEAARARVAAEFDLDVMVERVLGVYGEIVKCRQHE